MRRFDPNEPPKGMSPEAAEVWRKAPVAERLHAFKDYVLRQMGGLGDAPTAKDTRRCSYLWFQFRKACEAQGIIRHKAGEAMRYIQSCYSDPRYLHFRKWFLHFYRMSDCYKAGRRRYDHERADAVKAYRSQPEVRDKINERRRKSYDPAKRHERYLAKKAQSAKKP